MAEHGVYLVDHEGLEKNPTLSSFLKDCVPYELFAEILVSHPPTHGIRVSSGPL